MSPVQTGAPPVEDTPSPTRSLKRRAIAAPVLRNKSAMAASGSSRSSSSSRSSGPAHRGGPDGEGGAVFAPPSREFWLGTDGGGATWSTCSSPARGSRCSSGSRRGGLGDHRRHGRPGLRLLRREDRHRADANHGLLPRDPRHPADDRRRGALRPQPDEHHPDHRPHLLDVDRAPSARPDEERPRARLRAARPLSRRRQHRASIVQARAPAGDAAPVANTVLLSPTRSSPRRSSPSSASATQPRSRGVV